MATACHQSLMEVSRQFLFIEVGACSSDNSPMIFSENDPSPANGPLRCWTLRRMNGAYMRLRELFTRNERRACWLKADSLGGCGVR